MLIKKKRDLVYKYVYVITNLIDGKQYVGQAKDMNERFDQHCQKNTHYVSIVHDAILKYGKENFSVMALYYGEEYNEMEKYYIRNLHTKVPDGYNVADGGEEPPVKKREDGTQAKLTQKQVNKIQNLLIQGKSSKEINSLFPQVTQGQINRINVGEAWRNDSFTYPLQYMKGIDPETVKLIIEDLKNPSLTLKEIGEKYGYCKSAIVNINQGKTKLVKEIEKDFPIRKFSKIDKRLKLTKEQVIVIENELFYNEKTMKQISLENNVGWKVVDQINRGIYYLNSNRYKYPIR